MAKSRILTLDCETAPGLAWIWSLRDEYVPIDRIHTNTRILCIAAKWYGESRTYFFSEWTNGRRGMLKALSALVAEADAVVGQNSDKFDIPRINGELLLEGLPPLATVASIDVYKTVRKLGYLSSKLAYIGPLLEQGNKVSHEGFSLWTKVLAGDKAARKRMEKYNIQDVLLTEKVYRKVRPFIKTHPYLGSTPKQGCPTCGGNHVQSRGTRRTKSFVIQRMACQDCGAWSDGTRTGINTPVPKKKKKGKVIAR